MDEAYGVAMDTALLQRRTAAPAAWLAAQPHPALDRRRRLVETCRAELAWARADWLEVAGTPEGWPEACLAHEQAAARLVELWGHLHPLEDRLRRGLARLSARRRAGWAWQSTLGDVQRYRGARQALWRAFLAAARDYRDQRAKAGSTDSASRWSCQNDRTASNLWRRAS